MQKPISLFLALALLCSLYACAAPSPTESNIQEEAPYTVTDILVFQAITMAQKIGLCAQDAYQRAMQTPAELISIAKTFAEAAKSEPAECQILTTDDPQFAQQITYLNGQLLSSSQIACCSLLAHSTLFRSPKTLSDTTVIYLRYSDACHVAVVFVPGENKTVSALAYPLFFETAEALLTEHFKDANTLNASQIKTAKQNGGKASLCAKPTGNQINADYYADIAKSVFGNVAEVTTAQIAAYTEDEAIIQQVLQMSRALTLTPFDVDIYRFPNSAQQQINDILVGIPSSDLLQEITRQQIYLSYPMRFSNAYGVEQIVANSILTAVIDTQGMGAVAQEAETPLIAVMGFTSELTVILCIYPNAYNIYCYSYACLPCSFEDVTDMMEDGEAERLQ